MTLIVDKVLEEAVSQSVKKLVQTVGENVELIRGIGYEINSLSDDIETFNARLEDAFKNSRANELQVLEVVMKKFRSVVNDAQDAVVTYTNLMNKHQHNCLAKSWDHIPLPLCGKVKDCADEIKFIRTRMKTIRQDHEMDLRSLTSYVQNDDLSPNQVGPVVEEDCFVGFEEDLKSIKDDLTKEADNFSVISIVGVPGTGKTTFAKKVFKDLSDKFAHCIWVHISQGFRRKQKFIEILNQVDKPTENFSIFPEEVLEQKIKVTLGDKKYFLVMDDIWEKNHWDCLKSAFPESKGSRVLATTRDQSVADSIGKSHSLPKLESEISWSLLKNIVFGKQECPKNSFETPGKTIANKCKGLPLAIVVIAGILRKCRTVAEWKRVAENPFLEINRNDQIYHKIVKLSYNHLPHEKLKNCFLYFASFPMGYEIPARKLIRLWTAEEFILTKDERGGYPLDVEAEAQRYLNDLADRNLVKVLKTSADGQIKVCCILDSLYEFCKIEAANRNLFHVLDGRHELDLNTIIPRRLCCTSDVGISDILDAESNVASRSFIRRYIKRKTPSSYSYGKHVHSLLLSSSQKSDNQLTPEQLETIPNTFPLLRVLDIESHNFSLPSEKLYGLEHLRYLAIKTDLPCIPKPFKNFRSLETLVFRTTENTVEFTEAIWDMEKLRHVCTNTSAHLPSPPKTGKSSPSIRTLSTISPESCTEEIFSRTPKLQKLGVRGNLAELLEEKDGVCLFNYLQKLSFLENLKLHHQSEKVSKVPMPNKFPSSLRKLTLSNTFFDWKDISILAMLDEMEVMKLDDNAFKGEIWVLDKKVVFKQLQYLRIGRSNLVSWTAEEISFPVLESLVLRNCIFLEGIPDAIANRKGLKVHVLFDGSEKAANSARKVGPVMEEDCFVGFDADLEEIKTRLTEAPDNFSVISIVGMPGTGKTTFAKKVFKDIGNKFVICIWIHVSQGFNRKQKFINILNQVDKSTEFHAEEGLDLEQKIKNTLGKQKYFLVMDDVWEKKHWEFLRTAFPKSEGSRVLVTTRNQSVADSIGDYSHSLPVLSPGDSWLLLEKKVFGEERCPDESLKALGEKIATGCNGLPLAIVTIAGILRVSRTPTDWERVAENPFLEVNRKDQVYHKIVMLSYNNLPDENLRNCFLYFASFPMGLEISARKLICLWIAEDFIHTRDERGVYPLDVEVKAQKYLSDLVDRNLVKVSKRSADGQIKMCSIIDSLHEFCKIEAAKKNLFHVMDGRHRLDVNTISPRRLCYHFITNTFDIAEASNTFDAEHNASPTFYSRFIKKKSQSSYGQHVHSLLLSSIQRSESPLKQEQLASIPNNFPLLRVLDIESHNFSLPPEEFYGLELLKYLAIKTDLDCLPKPFKNFRALETLVFKTTKNTLEINEGIWDMEKLRHVCTNTSAHLPSPPKTSKNGYDIRTLSTISPASCTEEIFKKTPKLQKLGVRGNLEELLRKRRGICLFMNLQTLNYLENLKLHGQSGTKLPMPNKLPSNLRKLTLSNTFFDWKDISILATLDELVVLKLDDNAFTGEIWDVDNNVIFKQLQYLRIGRSNLVTWTTEEISFPVLESLVLRNCTLLEGIPIAIANKMGLTVQELFDESEKAANSTRKVGPVVDNDCFVGFENDLETVKDRLIKASDNFIVVSIMGMFGTGKTTFAKKIFDDPDIRHKFTHCISVDVSQSFDIKKILIHMLREITACIEDFSNASQDQLESKVKEVLKDKKCFILMDDVWEKENWGSLKAAFPKNLEGNIGVLVTTRICSVADYIGERHSLSVLSPNDSWVVLEKKVFGEKGCVDESLRAIGREIATRCNGLPLAIVRLARILRASIDAAYWERVAKNPFLEISRKDQSYHMRVMLSYNHLSDEKLKFCFLYFACFPMGEEIPAWKLIRLWTAEGFIQTSNDELGNSLDIEVEAHRYLDDLVDKNLVRVLKRRADGQIKTCRIDDSLHEFCKSEAAKKDLFQSCFNKKRTPHACIEDVESLLMLCHTKKKMSEVNLTQEQLATIRNTFPHVKVLDIESFNLSVLPNDLFDLKRLKYLAITTDLTALPKSFKNLCELETFVFRSTEGTLEIKEGIWNMQKLRHVHTNTSLHLPLPPKNSSASIEIRTLSTISPASCTQEIFRNTPKLQKLGIRGDLTELLEEKQGVCSFNNLQSLNYLENLKLHGQSGNVSMVPMKDKFPRMLRNLTLSNTLFKWNDMSILGSLEDLKVLKLDENAFTGELWDLNQNVVFSGLQYLRIGKTNLVTWTATNKSFPVLESLVIRNCTHLEGIPNAFAEVDNLKVMELFHVSESTIDSANEVNEQRGGREDIKPFNLLITSLPPKAMEHKQPHVEENVNNSGFDLPTTSVPSQTMEHKETDSEVNGKTNGFDFSSTSIPSQVQEHKERHGEKNVDNSGFNLPTTSHAIFERIIEVVGEEYKHTHNEVNVNTSGFDTPSTSKAPMVIPPVVEEDDVVGFDGEAKMIKDRIIGGSTDLIVISIEGMAGLGKTTLANMLFKDLEIQYQFFTFVWVYVSRTFNRRQIFYNILSKFTEITREFHDMPEENLADKIKQFLKDGKYLIVMDDVWRERDWECLKTAFPNNMEGSRVLVTTRNHDVALHVDSASNPHQLKGLSSGESWKLLEKKVFRKQRCPISLKDLGMCIAIKCRGLPLVVVHIAGILVGELQTPTEWKRIAEDPFPVINKYCQSYNEVVKLSYDDLPSPHLKSCFLYLSVFPRGHEIAVWKLIRLWIAEGFIDPTILEGAGYTSDLERTAEKYLKELVDRNLLKVLEWRADGRIKTCCMHDMFYEFCKTEAAKENLFHEIMDGAYKHLGGKGTPSRICIHSSVLDFLTLESKIPGQDVRSFLSFCSEDIKIPEGHLAAIPKSFPLLQVMDVESFKFNSLISLPREFYKLCHVKYLAISTDLKLLPKSFGDLSSLQTLVFNTSQNQLEVKADIWSMSKLRHVHSNTSMQLRPPSKIRKSSGISTDVLTLSTISPSSCKREILEKTPKLQKLGIRGNLAELIESKGGISLFDNLQKLDYLENLKLLNEAIVYGQAAGRVPRVPGHDKFPPRLRKLTLSNTLFPWMDMRVLGGLVELEILKLEEYAFVGESWELDIIVFRNLRFLRIGRTDLVSWTIWESCFPVLETLVIRDCTHLQQLPSEFAKVHTLKLLELFHPNKMAANSARQIQTEQLQSGVHHLKLSIYNPDY